MNIIPTAIPEVLIIEPKVFKDHRGLFLKLGLKKNLMEKCAVYALSRIMRVILAMG